jgi:hypothetical protein
MERYNKLFSDVDLFLDLRSQNLTLPVIIYYTFLKIRLVSAYVSLRVLEWYVAPTFIWTEWLVAWGGKEQGRKISRPRCEGCSFMGLGFLPWPQYSNTTKTFLLGSLQIEMGQSLKTTGKFRFSVILSRDGAHSTEDHKWTVSRNYMINQ